MGKFKKLSILIYFHLGKKSIFYIIVLNRAKIGQGRVVLSQNPLRSSV